MRPPQGPGVSISDQATPENLPALVERLAGKIRDHPRVQITWKPADEADHFTVLGKWCLDNGLAAEGAEAIESALALGDSSRTTHMLQVKAYAMRAYPENLRWIIPRGDYYLASAIAPDSLAPRGGRPPGLPLVFDAGLSEEQPRFLKSDMGCGRSGRSGRSRALQLPARPSRGLRE